MVYSVATCRPSLFTVTIFPASHHIYFICSTIIYLLATLSLMFTNVIYDEFFCEVVTHGFALGAKETMKLYALCSLYVLNYI